MNEQTHTDHPSRHWDRTCPACIEQWDTSDMAYRPNGLTVDVTDLIQRAIDMERAACAQTYRKIMDDAIRRAIFRERERVIRILKGIDQTETESEDGYWETSTGAEFGAKILKEIRGGTE